MTSSPPAIAYAIPANAPVRLTSYGIRAPREAFVQLRRAKPDFVCFLVSDGEIHLTDEMPNGPEKWTVRPGELHVVAPGIWQSSSQPFAPGIRFYWLHWAIEAEYRLVNAVEAEAAAGQEMTRASGQTADGPAEWLIPRHFSLGEEMGWFAHLHGQMQDSARLPLGGRRGPDLLATAFLYQLQRQFSLTLLKGDGGQSGAARTHVQRARVFVRLNAHRPISTRHVADAVSLNPAYLQRCFKKELGYTLGEYILNQRIAISRQLLQDHSLSIKEIAHQSGFASSTYFGRSFARTVGCTPTEFRTKSKQT